jgi:hypothetical protein
MTRLNPVVEVDEVKQMKMEDHESTRLWGIPKQRLSIDYFPEDTAQW